MRPPCNVRPMSQGTSAPVEVAPGWYTLPEQVANASHQTGSSPCEPGSFCALGVKWPCPPGTFGNSSQLQNPACSGMCDAGYGTYREALVRVQRTPDVIEKAQHCACDPHRYYCDGGAIVGTQHPCGDASVYCPMGSGVPAVAVPGEYTTGPAANTRNSTLPCPSGSFCLDGVRALCPAGRFGCADRLSTAGCNGPCTAGFFCPLGSNSSQA